MKTYILSGAESFKHVPQHPERTASRGFGGLNLDRLYKVWPARESMARSIRMQQKRAPHQNDWRPYVPLKDGEGY